MKDMVALVSGIGDGLGMESARLFAAHGAKLVLTARRPEALEGYADELRAAGAECETVICDIRNAADCAAARDAALNRFGRIDVLLNNAFRADELNYKTILEADPDLENWRGIIDTNIFGTIQMIRAVAPIMTEQGSGSIIIVNSMASDYVHVGQAGYAGSKGALVTFGRVFALELAPYGVRVNNYHPGMMWGNTAIKWLENRAKDNDTSLELEKSIVEKRIPLGRIPTTAECAKPVLFLASDLSSAMTGQSIHANGGEWFN